MQENPSKPGKYTGINGLLICVTVLISGFEGCKKYFSTIKHDCFKFNGTEFLAWHVPPKTRIVSVRHNGGYILALRDFKYVDLYSDIFSNAVLFLEYSKCCIVNENTLFHAYIFLCLLRDLSPVHLSRKLVVGLFS